ncbi:MAG: GerMN domain-containing protein [Firmicutes bacterium]|nr:GerMN domain-containing protein [Bacillota bacterium]
MYKKVQRYLLIVTLLLILASISACGGSDNDEEASVTITPVDNQANEEPTPEDVVMLDDAIEKYPVVLYFANDQGFLVAQQREVPKVDGIARMTMQELVKGPEGSAGLLPTLPPGTSLKDINIRDGLCTVDLSQEFKENHSGGSSTELLSVYSIVNTLTQFPTVEKVQIWVNGQQIDTLAGHVDVSTPLSRDDAIITSTQ